MIIKLTKNTKPLLDAALISVGSEKLKELGINESEYELFIIENEMDVFDEKKLQDLFKKLNLYNYITSKLEYINSVQL